MAKPAQYLVRARARNGALVEKKYTASSEQELKEIVSTQGMTVISIEQAGVGLKREIRLGKGKVKLKELAVFSRQFATMLNAGLPILKSLSILAEQSENPRLRETLFDVKSNVEKGDSLSEAMSKREEFPNIMVAMIKAGEVGGFLDTTMLQIAETFEADVHLRGKIKSALTYPVAVAVIAIVITIGMLIFIIPVFSTMFQTLGGDLPLPTQILVDASNMLKNPMFFIPVLVITIGGSIWYKRNKKKEAVTKVLDPLKFKIPVFGNLFKKVSLARFTRNFSTLLASGVPILAALDIVADTSGNYVIAQAIEEVKISVREGQGMAGPLSEFDVFPDMVVQMIAVGEDTGALDTMLEKIADFYDQEVESTTEQLMALIEPIMIMGLGGLVGGMIVAMYLPIFKIFELIN